MIISLMRWQEPFCVNASYNPHHVRKGKFIKTKIQRAAIRFIELSSLEGESSGFDPWSI